MKNLKLFVLLTMLSVMSFSCGSDDDNNDSNDNTDNVLVFGDTEYELKSGIIEDYGLYSDGVYNFDIILITSEITTEEGEPVPTDTVFSGVYFELFTDNQEDLEVGTYTFGSDDANAYEYGDIIINASVDSDDDNFFEITSGTFTVLNNGSNYEFDFEGSVEGGTEFSGHYEGTLLAFDNTEDDLDRSSTPSLKAKRQSFKK